jgi:hypothetical protein
MKTKLHIEIEEGFDKLNKMEVGTDKHKTAVDELSKLMDRAIELEKVEIDARDKKETRENETQLRLKQMDDDRKDRLIRNCLTGASILSGIGVTVWGALKSWKFEETGTVTSMAGRKFIGNLFNRK